MVSTDKGEGGWVTQKDGIPDRWSRMSEGAVSWEWPNKAFLQKGSRARDGQESQVRDRS